MTILVGVFYGSMAFNVQQEDTSAIGRDGEIRGKTGTETGSSYLSIAGGTRGKATDYTVAPKCNSLIKPIIQSTGSRAFVKPDAYSAESFLHCMRIRQKSVYHPSGTTHISIQLVT